MSDPKTFQEFQRKIEALRHIMVGLRSDDHWLKVSRHLRAIIAEAFERLTPEELSKISGFPPETFARWRVELARIGQLREMVRAAKGNKSLRSSKTLVFRGEIVALTKFTSIRDVGSETGVSHTTLMHWIEEGWDRIALPNTLISIPVLDNASMAAPTVDETAEGKELAALLQRHAGKVRRKYSQSERRLLLALIERFGSKLVHERFQVSYDTLARLQRHARREVEVQKRAPLRYAPVLELMKQHPGMGPMQVRDYIRRHHGLSMGVASIRRVMEDHGWVPPFVRSPRIRDEEMLYEAVRRNYLWHLDFKHQYINSCKVFILFVQDDYSRFIVNFAIGDGEKIELVVRSLDQAIRLHGRAEVVMSDGGSAFFSWRGVSQLTRYLEDAGTDQIIAKTPNVNGKLENLNQQVEKELLLVNNFSSLEHFAHELGAWVSFYNFRRPHQGLGGHQVPADRYFPGAATWYAVANDTTRQQSLIAETMATLLTELKKPT